MEIFALTQNTEVFKCRLFKEIVWLIIFLLVIA